MSPLAKRKGWVTMAESLLRLSVSTQYALSLLLPLSLYFYLCLSFTLLLSFPFDLIFTYWPADLMVLRGVMLIMCERKSVALINQWKKRYSIEMGWQELPPALLYCRPGVDIVWLRVRKWERERNGGLRVGAWGRDEYEAIMRCKEIYVFRAKGIGLWSRNVRTKQ